MTTINEYALQQVRAGRGVIIQTKCGMRLSMLNPIPGWGGFGNNRGSDNIILDGRPIRLLGDRSASIGHREFEFVNKPDAYDVALDTFIHRLVKGGA